MQCPQSPEYWQKYSEEMGDPEATRHLESCAHCRREVERAARVNTTLAHLAAVEVPPAVAERLQSLVQITRNEQITCAQTLEMLEAFREDALDPVNTFLVQDHLLWCRPCSEALEQAELVTAALHAMPLLPAPAAVAERIALARRPWWERLLPDLQPSWARLAPALGSLAAVAAMFALLLRAPLAPLPVAVHVQPVRVETVTPADRMIAERPPVVIVVPETSIIETPAPANRTNAGTIRIIHIPQDKILVKDTTNTDKDRKENNNKPAIPKPRLTPVTKPGPVIAVYTPAPPNPNSPPPPYVAPEETKVAPVYPDVDTRGKLASFEQDLDLALSEEALSDVPNSVKIASAQPTHVEKISAPVAPPAAPPVDVRALTDELRGKLRGATSKPAPIIRGSANGKNSSDSTVLWITQ